MEVELIPHDARSISQMLSKMRNNANPFATGRKILHKIRKLNGSKQISLIDLRGLF